jgi:anti-sigma factor NepR-like protein
MTIEKNSGGKHQGDPRPQGCPARFGPEIKRRIGQQLRVMYSEIMNQGMPDGHHELLQQLDAPDRPCGGRVTPQAP